VTFMIGAKLYEQQILKFADWLESYSTPIGIAGSAICGLAFGKWGYEAGGVGGAIFFTVMGLLSGGMLGKELSKTIIIALGTLTRLMVLLFLVAASITLKFVLDNLSFGLFIFITTCLYLYYLRFQDAP